MDKKPLEIELFRYGRIVFGKVLHQSEEITSNTSDMLLYHDAVANFSIKSHVRPDVCSTSMYVRGRNAAYDNDVFVYTFANDASAVALCEKIKSAVDGLNEKYAPQHGSTEPLGNIIKVI